MPPSKHSMWTEERAVVISILKSEDGCKKQAQRFQFAKGYFLRALGRTELQNTVVMVEGKTFQYYARETGGWYLEASKFL